MRLNPVGLVITAIQALVAGFVYAYNEVDGFREVMWGLWEAAKAVGKALLEGLAVPLVHIGELIQAFKANDWAGVAKAGGKLLIDFSGAGHMWNMTSAMFNNWQNIKDAYSAGKEKGAGKDPINVVKMFDNRVGGVFGAGSTAGIGASAGLSGIDPTGGSETQAGINSTNGGGSRVRNVSVKFNNLVETINLNSENLREGADEIRRILLEEMVRVVGGSEQVLSNG
jgi:hypothetical protein